MSCITCGLDVSRGGVCVLVVNPMRRIHAFSELGYDEQTFKVYDVHIGYFSYGKNGTDNACFRWHGIAKGSIRYPNKKIEYQAVAVFAGYKVLGKDTIASLSGIAESGRPQQDMGPLERVLKKEYVRRFRAAAVAKRLARVGGEPDIQQPLASPASAQGLRAGPTSLNREVSSVSANAAARSATRPRPVPRQVPSVLPAIPGGPSVALRGGPQVYPAVSQPGMPHAPQGETRTAPILAQRVQTLRVRAPAPGSIALPPVQAPPPPVVPQATRQTTVHRAAGPQPVIPYPHAQAPRREDEAPPAYEDPPPYEDHNFNPPPARRAPAQALPPPQAPPVIWGDAPARIPPQPAPLAAPLVTFAAPVAGAPAPEVPRRRRAGRPSARQGGGIDPLIPAMQAVLPAASLPFSFNVPAPSSVGTGPSLPAATTFSFNPILAGNGAGPSRLPAVVAPAPVSAEEARPRASPDAAALVDEHAGAPTARQVAAAGTWSAASFMQALGRLNPLAQCRFSFGWPSDST